MKKTKCAAIYVDHVVGFRVYVLDTNDTKTAVQAIWFYQHPNYINEAPDNVYNVNVLCYSGFDTKAAAFAFCEKRGYALLPIAC